MLFLNIFLLLMAMKKHVWIIIAIFCVIMSLPGLTSASSVAGVNPSNNSWTMFLHSPTHDSIAITENSPNTAKLLWKTTVMGEVVSSPAVVDGRVFVGCNDGAVYCFNSSTGEILWFFYQKETEVLSSPAFSDGYLYVGCNNGNLYALNASSGKQLWSFTTGGWVVSSPAVADGLVYVGSRDGNLYALNASNGAKLWSFQTGSEVESSPAVSDGVVYIASRNFFVYALNASTGKRLWQTHTGSTFSSPSVYGGCLYIGSYDGYIYCLNASTGTRIWTYLTQDAVISSPVIAYSCVYVGSEDNNVYCLNASTGSKIWQSPTGYWVTSSPTVACGNVYVGSEDDNIYCLNASTGAKEWLYQTGNYVESSPAIVDNTLYVGSDDFHVYAFSLVNYSGQTSLTTSSNSLPWTTVVLDVSACVIGVAIILGVVLFVCFNRRDKRGVQLENASVNRSSWLSRHVDAFSVVAILAFSALFFVNLGSGHLIAADEQTYSQWAFHMVKTGDYVTPWAFGAFFWIGKPPLVMWLMALSYQVFGITNFAVRFWSPVFGVSSLIVIYFLGKKLYNSYVGFMSAVVLGTFATFYTYSRLAMTDIPLVFFILCSIYFFILNEKNERSHRNAVLAGLFFGLALMTKQLEALLVLLIIILYLAVSRKSFRFLFAKAFTLFWGIALLVFSPWIIYMVATYGFQFIQWYFVYNVVSRSVSVVGNHAGSYLYYFSFMVHNENPFWMVLLPFAVAVCVFNAFVKGMKADILVLFWMAAVLLVFSVAQTKLGWYIIPVLPAFALAVSSFIYRASKKTCQLLKTRLSGKLQ